MDYEKELHQLLREQEEKRKRDIEDEMLKEGIITRTSLIKNMNQDTLSSLDPKVQEQKYKELINKRK